MWKPEDNLKESIVSFHHSGSWGLNQAWQQAPSPAEPTHWPKSASLEALSQVPLPSLLRPDHTEYLGSSLWDLWSQIWTDLEAPPTTTPMWSHSQRPAEGGGEEQGGCEEKQRSSLISMTTARLGCYELPCALCSVLVWENAILACWVYPHGPEALSSFLLSGSDIA